MSDPTLITVRLIISDGLTSLSRTINVPEVPRMGDLIHVNPEGTICREVIGRDWDYNGSPLIYLNIPTFPANYVPTETFLDAGWAKN